VCECVRVSACVSAYVRVCVGECVCVWVSACACEHYPGRCRPPKRRARDFDLRVCECVCVKACVIAYACRCIHVGIT
jgi:hypothetical protein